MWTEEHVDRLLILRDILLPLGLRIPTSVCSRLEKKLKYNKFQLTIAAIIR